MISPNEINSLKLRLLVLLYKHSDLMLKGLVETQQMADWSVWANRIRSLMQQMPKSLVLVRTIYSLSMFPDTFSESDLMSRWEGNNRNVGDKHMAWKRLPIKASKECISGRLGCWTVVPQIKAWKQLSVAKKCSFECLHSCSICSDTREPDQVFLWQFRGCRWTYSNVFRPWLWGGVELGVTGMTISVLCWQMGKRASVWDGI